MQGMSGNFACLYIHFELVSLDELDDCILGTFFSTRANSLNVPPPGRTKEFLFKPAGEPDPRLTTGSPPGRGALFIPGMQTGAQMLSGLCKPFASSGCPGINAASKNAEQERRQCTKLPVSFLKESPERCKCTCRIQNPDTPSGGIGRRAGSDSKTVRPAPTELFRFWAR